MASSQSAHVVATSRLTRILVVGLVAVAMVMIVSASAFAGEVVPGNPTELSEVRFENPVSMTYSYGDIQIQVTVRSTTAGPVFDFTSSAPVVRAVAKGGKEGATVYTYNPAVMSGTGLHAPVNPSGDYAGLSWIGFSFGDDPPGDDPPGDDPPGDDPPGDDPPGDDPPGDDPPGDDPPGDDPPGDDPPGDDPPGDDPPAVDEPSLPFTEAADPVVKAAEEPFLPFTGGPATLLLGSALAAIAGTTLRRLAR